MIHPGSNSLLVLYDDAQSIYNGPKKLRFTFSSVGIQAKGRTTILKLNYRNTEEIMAVAKAFADDLLTPSATEDDEAPTVQPTSAGRRGAEPILRELSSLQEEAELIAGRLANAHSGGMPWRDMAVIYRDHGTGMQIASVLKRKRIPFQCQKEAGFSPDEESVKGLTMHSSKGLEFPLVCIPGLGAASPTQVSHEEARLLYVAMTRATQQLVMTHSGTSAVVRKMRQAMSVLRSS
jgi:superfamily I DNA/RNA helicase